MKEELSGNAEQNVETYLAQRMEWIADAAEVLSGDRSADPRKVLPKPNEVRADDPGLDLSAAKEADLREVAGRFGLGGEIDVESGADYEIKEGGKAWKVDAEARLGQNAKAHIFAGSPDRILGEDEVAYMQKRIEEGEVAKTEYDMVRQLAELQPDFLALSEPQVLPFGYDINDNHALVNNPTGQLVKIGDQGNTEVMLLRVDRENYIDDDGNKKFRNRPDSAALMTLIGNVLSAKGDEASSVGIATSTTYASRAVDTVRAGLKNGRTFAVGMYGRQTLADVKESPVAEPTDIKQIPGELREMYEKLVSLKEELKASSQDQS